MSVQQDNISDTTIVIKDSVQLQDEEPSSVFLNEVQDSPVNYKMAEDIKRELTPDWVLYFSIASLIILAWIRLIYSKFIINIFKSTMNYQLALKVFTDPGLIQKRIFLFLNIFYYLTTGIFI